MRTYHKINLTEEIEKNTAKPKIELKPEQIDTIKQVSSAILWIIAGLGLATMAIVAPNALQALAIFEKKKSGKRLIYKDKVVKLRKYFYYLKNHGYVEFQTDRLGGWYVRLTAKGRKKIKALNLATISVSRQRHWDGKFWQVAADIPTKNFRRGADSLREKLKQMGFFSLQRTLWFYPFDPREQLSYLVKEFKIEPFVTVMRIDHLDPADKKVLKDHFIEAGVV